MKTFHFECLTINNVSPVDKKHVFVSYHKDDFKIMIKYAEMIRDLLDVAVYYLDYKLYPNPNVEDFQNMVQRMDMFVPIISKSYLDNSYELSNIYSFVKKQGIPILPLLVEDGIEPLFNKICGKIQFLDTKLETQEYSDVKEKIKRFYGEIISPEAYRNDEYLFPHKIFISYRRRDRHKARRLIDLLLNDDHFNGVAIWYDEFLTIGGKYDNEIAKKLKNSDIVIMYITNSVFQGKNYVKDKEYILAKTNGKQIIPVYDEPFDHDEYKRCFPDLREPIHVDECLKKIKELTFVRFLDADRECLYAIAYLYGIDVIRNINKAERILLRNGDKHPKSAQLLVEIYTGQFGCKADFKKAIYYGKKLSDFSHIENKDLFFSFKYSQYIALLMSNAKLNNDKSEYQRIFEMIYEDIKNHEEEFFTINVFTYTHVMNIANALTVYRDEVKVIPLLIKYFETLLLSSKEANLTNYQIYDVYIRLFRSYKKIEEKEKIFNLLKRFNNFIKQFDVKTAYDIIASRFVDGFRQVCSYIDQEGREKEKQYLDSWKEIYEYIIDHVSRKEDLEQGVLFIIDKIVRIRNFLDDNKDKEQDYEGEIRTIEKQIEERRSLSKTTNFIQMITEFIFLVFDHHYDCDIYKYVSFFKRSYSSLNNEDKNRAIYALYIIDLDKKTKLDEQMNLLHYICGLLEKFDGPLMEEIQQIKDENQTEIFYTTYLIRKGQIYEAMELIAKYQDPRVMEIVDSLLRSGFKNQNID